MGRTRKEESFDLVCSSLKILPLSPLHPLSLLFLLPSSHSSTNQVKAAPEPLPL